MNHESNKSLTTPHQPQQKKKKEIFFEDIGIELMEVRDTPDLRIMIKHLEDKYKYNKRKI